MDIVSGTEAPGAGATDPAPAAGVDRRMALAGEWERLLAEVRRLEGFQDFLLPPRLEQLRRAATGGPVAVINVSRWRCDALVITSDGVLPPIPLRGLSSGDAVARANEYLTAVQRFEAAQRAVYTLRQQVRTAGPRGAGAARQALHAATVAFMAERTAMDEQLNVSLAWLWDVVAEPVLDAIGCTEPVDSGRDVPRLWWCPTGALTLLPLHAAGHHGAQGEGRAVIDRVVSSYTPTIRALAEAYDADPGSGGSPRTEPGRRPAGSAAAPPRLLVVAVPEVPGQPRLANVGRELDVLDELFPAPLSTRLIGDQATPDAVLDELGRHCWAHFSCHGDQNLGDPSRGGLVLGGGMLTVGDISRGRHGGDFAYLSACKTATGGVALTDEVITLAAALHFTGYRHVIATLWSVFDPAAAEVTVGVYRRLATADGFDPAGAARALHDAVREVRARHLDRPSVWIPFAHIGP